MHDAGAPTLSILTPIEVDVPWDELDSSASGLKTNSSDVEASMSDVGTSWGGLQAAYKQPASQETVWSAMDEVPGVVQDWADTMDSAGNIIQDFVTEGRPLQETAESLRTQAWILEGRLAISRIDIFGLISDDETDEDSQLRQDIDQHNQDVLNFNSDWRSLENRISGRLEALHGASGRNLEIPRVYADGTARPNVPGGGFADSFDLGQIALAASDSPSEAVEEAEELYGDAMAEGATGEDQEKFLEHLGDMDPEDIEEFADRNEDANLYNLPAPSSDEDLAEWPDGAFGVAWWNKAEENGTHEALKEHLPLITGNVQGVPSEVRDEANSQAAIDIIDSGEHSDYEANLDRILEAALSDNRYLLSLDVGMPGEERPPLAEVSVGDPDDYDEITYSAPGMNSGTHRMDNEVNRAHSIYEDSENQAVVAWMGYEPPTTEETIPETIDDMFLDENGNIDVEKGVEELQNLNDWETITNLYGAYDELFQQEGSVMSDSRADAGGYRFAHSLDSHQQAAEANGKESSVNVVAHSYGTNMTAHALTRTEHDVQTVTFMGSSGIPEDVAPSADCLNVEDTSEGNPAVFVTEAAGDNTAMFGRGFSFEVPFWYEEINFPGDHRFDSPRIDPRSEEFNAYAFSSDADPDVHGEEGDENRSVDDHTRYDNDREDYGYLDPATLSYNTIIDIIGGSYDSVEYIGVPQ